MPEVILETGTGDFSLDAASGGIAALVDVAWQIHMRSRSDATFTVLMDEPKITCIRAYNVLCSLDSLTRSLERSSSLQHTTVRRDISAGFKRRSP